jgi:hypothetical protein
MTGVSAGRYQDVNNFRKNFDTVNDLYCWSIAEAGRIAESFKASEWAESFENGRKFPEP